jgi:hypothetical protein
MRALPFAAGLGMLALQPGAPADWAAVAADGMLLPVCFAMAGMAALIIGTFGLLALAASMLPGGIRK